MFYGPEWIHTNAYGRKTNSIAAEVAPDFMFWSSKKHRLGWYLEPSYEYKFGPGHEHTLGITAGLLIGIRSNVAANVPRFSCQRDVRDRETLPD